MAKAKFTKETVEEVVEAPVEVPAEENVLVDVEYAEGKFSTTFYGEGFRVEFVDGKAVVTAEIANKLKELKLIK